MQVNETNSENQEMESNLDPSLSEQEQQEIAEQEIPQEDFSGYSKNDIVEKLAAIAASDDVDPYRNQVNQLRDLYKNLTREEIEQKKKEFESSKESAEEEFEYHNPLDEKFEKHLKDYNTKRADLKKKKEKQLNDNLKQKKEILESLKTLPENTTNISAGFEKLQSLQALWRSIGPVPAGLGEELYKSYQFYVGKFYEGVKLSNELKDLDRKKNLELKTELCEKAEKLADEPSVKKAMEQLAILQDQWRQIGAAGKDTNDAIWERFKAAVDKVYEKKRKLQEGMAVKQEENLQKKTALVEKLTPYTEKEYHSHKEWQDAVEQVDAIFEEWKKIGPVPPGNNDEVWKSFRGLRSQFMERKDKFYSKRKDEERDNLKLKEQLCVEAESLKDSNDWRFATDKLKNLQAKWKEVGPVPRKDADKIWKRFRAACDHFFNRKTSNFEEQKAKVSEGLKERDDFLESINATEASEDQNINTEQLKTWKEKWESMGELSREDKGKYSSMYKKATDAFMEKIKAKGGDPRAFERMRYQQLATTDEGKDQIMRERSAINQKIKKIEAEVIAIENNMGFFGKSKNASAMLADFQKKIDDGKAEIAKLKEQLKVLPRIEEPARPEPQKNFKGNRPRR